MLDSFFFKSADKEPDAPALCLGGETISYGNLSLRAKAVSHALRGTASVRLQSDSPKRCLLFAHRSVYAYSALLGILDAGMAYVPLNPGFPVDRNAAVARRSGCEILLVDRRCLPQLPELLERVGRPVVVLPIEEIEATHIPLHAAGPGRATSDHAYILFTSGTTGTPKGVLVTHANACAYVENQLKFDPRMAGARYSQFFDLSFDPSVHDMFVCWGNGGCLYVPETTDPLYLAEFIRESRLTHWGSVPSAGTLMQQFRKLRPGAFPDLRMSMFCGEALPASLARAWTVAAPNSQIVNLYGPTEATVTCLRFDVTPMFLADFADGVVPLGHSLPGQESVIVDEALEPVADGERGELLLGGSQIADGYISGNVADHQNFFERRYPGCETRRWYRSGDVARMTGDYGLCFLGRTDSQLKIRGNRVELQEVEHVVASCCGASMVAVIAWPRDANGGAMGLVAFVNQPFGRIERERLLAQCRTRLPFYARPDSVIGLPSFPLDGNGKTDRQALLEICERSAATV
jgi:amino acid adenylation domain-containing protein